MSVPEFSVTLGAACLGVGVCVEVSALPLLADDDLRAR
jgi:hypothetical protein